MAEAWLPLGQGLSRSVSVGTLINPSQSVSVSAKLGPDPCQAGLSLGSERIGKVN